MRRYMLSAAASVIALGAMSGQSEAQVFMNDSFRVVQDTATTFDLFVNNDRVRTLTGAGDLQADFTQQELAGLLLANNNFNDAQVAMTMFTEFVDRDLSGLIDAQINDDTVIITFDRQLITENRSGETSFKYTGPRGRERNFVEVTGIGESDVPPDNSSPQVFPTETLPPPGDVDSRGGKGPFFNDTFTITQRGGQFLLDINGVELTPLDDTGDTISFQIGTDTFKDLVLTNNGVSGSFLREDTFFFEFLAKGNSGLIDVALRDDSISFDIEREFVLNEMSGESSFKYNALGQRARNFVNFIGVVDNASPSS